MRALPFYLTAAALAFAVVTGVTANTVLTHSGATGIVKQRMDAMKSIADNMKQLGAMMQGKIDFDASTVQASAAEIKQHAAEMPTLFPKDSNPHPSEALPEIWQDFEGFSKIASDLESAAAQLASVKTADDLKAGVIAAGQTCKACHEDYRKP